MANRRFNGQPLYTGSLLKGSTASDWRPSTEKVALPSTLPRVKVMANNPISHQEGYMINVINRPQAYTGNCQRRMINFSGDYKASTRTELVQRLYGEKSATCNKAQPGFISTFYKNESQPHAIYEINSKNRPETHCLNSEVLQSSSLANHKPFLKVTWNQGLISTKINRKVVSRGPRTYYGQKTDNNNIEEEKLKIRKFRPNTGKGSEIKEKPYIPQTAQSNEREKIEGRTKRIIRLSTPQTSTDKRPESRYKQATLCVGLNNGREKSPDYRVPIFPMQFMENMHEQPVFPSCWK